jgi:hypothetical protein
MIHSSFVWDGLKVLLTLSSLSDGIMDDGEKTTVRYYLV